MEISQLKDFILDLFFPKHCVACGAADTFLCRTCLAHIEPLRAPHCAVCGKKTIQFETHAACRKNQALDGLWYVGYFSDPILRAVIKSWKYDFLRDLEEEVGELIAALVLSRQNIFPTNAIIAPIPLHPKRRSWRGFNQADIIAQCLAKNLNVPANNLLRRTRNTVPQAELEEEKKINNVRGAFLCVDPALVRGRTVIVTDDCFTTGATMGEAAEVLKQAGAQAVWGFVLAKG